MSRMRRWAVQALVLAVVGGAGWLYGSRGRHADPPAVAGAAPAADTGPARRSTARTYIIDAASATVVVQQPDVLVPAPADAQASASAVRSSCRNQSASSARLGPAAAQRSLLCLINAERRRRGIRRLRTSGPLVAAGRVHAEDMIRHSYFRHDSLDGRNFARRILARGYVDTTQDWELGENLAWGAGDQSAPRAIVDAWLASPPHRANLLNPRFHEIGIAVQPGAPVPGIADSVTVATEYGVRR